VAHLVWRLVTDAALQHRYRHDEFYARFGVSRAGVSPFDNVYLKIFAAMFEMRPGTAAELLRGWAQVHPEDAGDLERIIGEVLHGQNLPDVPEIWLANPTMMTGTSMYDQYRGLPRPHTFDANAAMIVDWLGVPGVSEPSALRLIADAPYSSIDDLLASPVLPSGARAVVRGMAEGMSRLRSASGEAESLTLWAIARPYLARVGALILAASLTGAWLARRVGINRWWTAFIISSTATVIVVALAWVISSPVWYPAATPIIFGGIPWGAWRLANGRGVAAAWAAVGAWAVAAVPALILTHQW
jgi:hypothetical protein